MQLLSDISKKRFSNSVNLYFRDATDLPETNDNKQCFVLDEGNYYFVISLQFVGFLNAVITCGNDEMNVVMVAPLISERCCVWGRPGAAASRPLLTARHTAAPHGPRCPAARTFFLPSLPSVSLLCSSHPQPPFKLLCFVFSWEEPSSPHASADQTSANTASVCSSMHVDGFPSCFLLR